MYSNSRRSTFPGAKGNPGCLRSRGLYSGQLISAHHSLPRLDQGGSFSVQIADVSDFGVIVLVPGGCQPIAYGVIARAADEIADYAEKQQFLKSVYEDLRQNRTYAAYNPAAADRLGVVYTPN